MSTREIERLLDKFYDGSTSLQEEKILRNFFQSPGVPDNLKSHQPLFRFLIQEQLQKVSDPDFEYKLSGRLSDVPAETPVISINSHRKRFLFITGIAASFLLLAGLFFTFQHDIFRKSNLETAIPNPVLAYAEASEALMIVSSNLNSGLKEVERLQSFEKAMKPMQLFNKFYQYQTIIINPDELKNQSIKSK